MLRLAWSVYLKRFAPAEPVVVPFDEGRSRIYADMRTAFGRLLYRYRDRDPDLALLRWFVRPGDVFIDGGAHQGMFTIVAARAVGLRGSVYSFEPHPVTFACLQRNVALNGFGNVELLRQALSDYEGEASFAAMQGDRAPWSHLGGADAGDEALVLSTEVTTLASSIPPSDWDRVALIKLDVEGAELHALRGAEPILDAAHPPILMEFVPGHFEGFGVNPLDVLSFLTDKGYRLLRPSDDPDVWMPCSSEQAMHLDPERPNLLIAVSVERLRERGVTVTDGV